MSPQVATVVIPFRDDDGKSRIALPAGERAALAAAMLDDVRDACAAVARVVVARLPGGQGAAIDAALRAVRGPVAVVNADVPCATPADVEALLGAAPALVAAPDGTTNALALPDPSSFRPLYGAGSAARFAALGLAPLDRPNLADDVDTLDDLERIAGRLGPCTRAAVELVCARA